ncbi:heavy-metal-associated domain-containing protein [bacterium]|nr:heavy-metal-associated domain-containing protein [bacterium]
MKKINLNLFKQSLYTATLILFGLLPAYSAEQIKVKVNGFVCSLCGQGVEKQFKKKGNDAVSKFEVDMDSKIVTLTLKEGKQLDDAFIQKAIADAGYSVEEIMRDSKTKGSDLSSAKKEQKHKNQKKKKEAVKKIEKMKHDQTHEHRHDHEH